MRLLLAALLLAPAAVEAQFVSQRPAWTRRKPMVVKRGRERVAIAVGYAKFDNPALARAAAEGRARAELLRYLQKKHAKESFDGELSGAFIVDVWGRRDGSTYVRLELKLP